MTGGIIGRAFVLSSVLDYTSVMSFIKYPARLTRARLSKALSTRASTVLSALSFPGPLEELPGVYDGAWKGSGDVIPSICPTTGEVLARVRTVSRRLDLLNGFL